jgi:hypothetical protein
VGRPEKYPDPRRLRIRLPGAVVETLEAEAVRRGIALTDVLAERVMGVGAADTGEDTRPAVNKETVSAPHHHHYSSLGTSGVMRCRCGKVK